MKIQNDQGEEIEGALTMSVGPYEIIVTTMTLRPSIVVHQNIDGVPVNVEGRIFGEYEVDATPKNLRFAIAYCMQYGHDNGY